MLRNRVIFVTLLIIAVTAREVASQNNANVSQTKVDFYISNIVDANAARAHVKYVALRATEMGGIPPGYIHPGLDQTGWNCDVNTTRHCCPAPSQPFTAKDNRMCCSPTSMTPDPANCCVLQDSDYGQDTTCCKVTSLFEPEIVHCCPFPYLAVGRKDECCYSWGNITDCCPLPLLPSGKCCMNPGFAQDLPDKDVPPYDLVPQNYMPAMTKALTVHSEFDTCYNDEITRRTYGIANEPAIQGFVPIHWSQFLGISKMIRIQTVLNLFLDPTWNIFPEIILPFLFPLLAALVAMLSAIPILIIGGIFWAILYNLRFLGHKKIRMSIRAFLIRMEKVRRWKYERSFPRQHLRKFRQRDRYQMPKILQDSELSSDDEPAELREQPIPRATTTLYTEQEIKLFGYDPDNIPINWIYGDLLGKPEELAPEVKNYVDKKRRPSIEGDIDRASLNSDEWADLLRNRLTDKMKKEKNTFLTSLGNKLEGLKFGITVKPKPKGRRKFGSRRVTRSKVTKTRKPHSTR